MYEPTHAQQSEFASECRLVRFDTDEVIVHYTANKFVTV